MAWEILIDGVVPPDEDIGVEPETAVTVPPEPVAVIVIAVEPLYVVPLLKLTPVPAVKLNKLPPRDTPDMVEFANCALLIVPLKSVVGMVKDAVTLPEVLWANI